jgi:hypothetical protein
MENALQLYEIVRAKNWTPDRALRKVHVIVYSDNTDDNWLRNPFDGTAISHIFSKSKVKLAP